MKLCKVKATILTSFFFIFSASAQFNTVTRRGIVNENSNSVQPQTAINQPHTTPTSTILEPEMTLHHESRKKNSPKSSPQIQHKRKSLKFPLKATISDSTLSSLPLTLPNLVLVMRYYNIRHPRIVLAQAIQETGWLRSNVCRIKNNLFGLTNPRTGQYFVFGHWTESVRAYVTTIQYKYTGGDYLEWLEKIGYASDSNYTTSLKTIIRLYLSENNSSID